MDEIQQHGQIVIEQSHMDVVMEIHDVIQVMHDEVQRLVQRQRQHQ